MACKLSLPPPYTNHICRIESQRGTPTHLRATESSSVTRQYNNIFIHYLYNSTQRTCQETRNYFSDNTEFRDSNQQVRDAYGRIQSIYLLSSG